MPFGLPADTNLGMKEDLSLTAARIAFGSKLDGRSLLASLVQSWGDLRLRWRYGLLWALYFSIFIGFGLSLWFAALGSRGFAAAGRTACLPDGRFSTDPSTYNPWSRPGFFEITLGHGDLSYTQAKVIDIAWDVVSNPRGNQSVSCLHSDIDTDRGPRRASSSRICVMGRVCEICYIFDARWTHYLQHLSNILPATGHINSNRHYASGSRLLPPP